MNCLYELKKSKDKKQPFFFVLKGANGKTVLTSETYRSHRNTENAMRSLNKRIYSLGGVPNAARHYVTKFDGKNKTFHEL